MPEPHHAVAASGGEQGTVWRKGTSLDPACVAVKCRLRGPVGHAPESYRPVVADGGQEPAVRGECTADSDRIRVALDRGEVIELDGGTLVLDDEQSPSVVLRLAPWRARSVARVLQEWSSVAQIFQHPTRPQATELDLSRTLELAAASLGGGKPIVRAPRGPRVIPHRQRLAAVAILGEREAQLSAAQRLALVDAAAWWLSEPNGGEDLAYALLTASCSAEVTTEHAYLALITPSDGPEDHRGDQFT
jgi:hypothetical protein